MSERINAAYEAYEKLLDKWERELVSKNLAFVRDGVICLDDWGQAKIKILFVLRDTNQKKEGRDRSRDIVKEIAKAINDSKSGWWRRNVLRRVGRWAFGLISYEDRVPSFRDAKRAEKQAISSVAYVNLKKSPGGARVSKKILDSHVEQYTFFIKKQIELIGPNVVVLGGTYDQIKKYIFPDLRLVCERVYVSNDIVFIDSYHPAQRRISDEKLYLQVLESYHKYKLQNL